MKGAGVEVGKERGGTTAGDGGDRVVPVCNGLVGGVSGGRERAPPLGVIEFWWFDEDIAPPSCLTALP